MVTCEIFVCKHPEPTRAEPAKAEPPPSTCSPWIIYVLALEKNKNYGKKEKDRLADGGSKQTDPTSRKYHELKNRICLTSTTWESTSSTTIHGWHFLKNRRPPRN